MNQASDGNFADFHWEEIIPPSPFVGNDCRFDQLTFWSSSDKLPQDKEEYRRPGDEARMNNLLHVISTKIAFEAKKLGANNVNNYSLRKFITSRFEFSSNQNAAKDKLAAWFMSRIKYEQGRIRADYLAYLKEKYGSDEGGFLNEVNGKSYTGNFNGKSISGLSDIILENARVDGAIYDSTVDRIDSSSVVRKIEGDRSSVQTNDGMIWVSDCQIKMNTNHVEINQGRIDENQGVVKRNERSGVVALNGETGLLELNYGTITTNDGLIKDNPEGTVEINNKRLFQNSGTVSVNNGDIKNNLLRLKENNGSIDRNIGDIDLNNGRLRSNDNNVSVNGPDGVITENSGGRVDDNQGVIEENGGVISVNNNTINVNHGKVDENNKTIDENRGMIDINTGSVSVNSFMVWTNKGEVASNQKRVDHNEGAVTLNSGIVTVNDEGGKVINEEKAIIISNKGIASGGGTIVFNYKGGEIDNVADFKGDIKDDDPSMLDIFDML